MKCKGTIYAGIGSRKTPSNVLQKMRIAAATMARKNFVLRSGGARGADVAFVEGFEQVTTPIGSIEIFLPWDRFNGFSLDDKDCFGPPTKEARLIAKQFHPNWQNVGNTGRDFMARNAYQILGWDLQTPCDFVLCWTPDGKTVGGTGQALRHAESLGIPIFNFAVKTDEEISDHILSYM